MLQVVKRKDVGFELFKLTDPERIKEFSIVFGISERDAENHNKAFNIYMSYYFKLLRHRKFIQNPDIDLGQALVLIGDLDSDHLFIVDQYPTPENVLVTINSLVNLEVRGVDGKGSYSCRNSGQFYLWGARITLHDYREGRSISSKVALRYHEKLTFIEDYLNLIKFPTEMMVDLRKVLEEVEKIPDLVPIHLNYKVSIPKAMILIRTVNLLVPVSVPAKYEDTDSLNLEATEFGTEILKNEVSQEYDEDLFVRLSTLEDSGVFQDLYAFNRYEMTAKILSISESYGVEILDRGMIRDCSLMAWLIYLNIHDDRLHLNPESDFVRNFKSNTKNPSLLEYYIEFIVLIFRTIFGIDYRKSDKIIKNIYGTFIQTTRKKLVGKVAPGILIYPGGSCDLFLDELKTYIRSTGDRRGFREVQELHQLIFRNVEEFHDANRGIEYVPRQQTISIGRFYVKSISNVLDYYYTFRAETTISLLGESAEVPPFEGLLASQDPGKLPVSLSLGQEIQELEEKIGKGTVDDLENFGLFLKKMKRDEKVNLKGFDSLNYYRTAIQFIKSSAIEFIYSLESPFRKDLRYPEIFHRLEEIERIPEPEQAARQMRAYFFELLRTSGKTPGEIIGFLKGQQEFFEYYDLLEYDLEYKRQKKLEQYEKRNNIYYNLTPEEKLLLGIDKLHGEERMSLLDRLVAQKEAAGEPEA
jgi:hypothetical protein